LSSYELPIFKYGTHQRIIYAKTAATGSTVLDEEPSGDAANEIKQLAKELKEFVK